MMELGKNYIFLDSDFSTLKSFIKLQINGTYVGMEKMKSNIWNNGEYKKELVICSNIFMRIELSTNTIDTLYQNIMYLYTMGKPFSLRVPITSTMYYYIINGYYKDENTITLEFNRYSINSNIDDSLVLNLDIDVDNVDDFTEKMFFFYLNDLYNFDWYNHKVY